MSNVPLKDSKYSRLYVSSEYCSWKFFVLLAELIAVNCPTQNPPH